jgi:iron-sulfur cluster assembly protein
VAIKLTEKAATELRSLMSKEIADKNMSANAVLRLMVVGGGCSGFSYKMGFDEDVRPDDRIEELNGVRVAVDEKSYLYLSGTEVDFQDGLMGRGFVFQNPNASGSCGCGSSFSV